jgi:hippurate hydrolase
MIHVMASMPIKSATVIVSPPGVSAPAADYFEITVFGKGCHGSMPNCGVDPIIVSAHIITALEEIQTRELACDERATVTFGTVNGGTAANIIPDSVVMRGSIRTFDEETRAYIKKRICEVSEAIAAAFRARAQVEFGSGCPTLKNDRSLSLSAEKFCTELLGEENVLSASKLAQTGGRNSKSAGSEDFAYVSQQVPTIMLALAAGRPEDGYEYPQHHPMTRFDESVLSVGSAVYAYNAARMLEESLIKVHDEHKI